MSEEQNVINVRLEETLKRVESKVDDIKRTQESQSSDISNLKTSFAVMQEKISPMERAYNGAIGALILALVGTAMAAYATFFKR